MFSRVALSTRSQASRLTTQSEPSSAHLEPPPSQPRADPPPPSVALLCCRSFRSASWWSHVPQGPADPILGVSEAFKRDTDPKKLNLGVGAYRDDNNKPVIIKSVKEATKRIHDDQLNNEYAPIAGDPEFIKLALQLAYGDAAPLKAGKVAGLQALSGTGALRLIGAFVNKFSAGGAKPTVYVPNPTWGNHNTIFGDSGLQVKPYRYYLPKTKGLDLDGLLADVKAAPEKSVFVFHACAHNPTGVDPRPEQWRQISAAVKERQHFVVVDSAYQGFASGDPTKDAFAIQQFVQDGHQIALAQSFSKNFGLYGQRVGCVSFITDSAAEASNVESQVKILARAMYSNPPIHGSRIVSTILKEPALKKQWHVDVKEMAERIISMRDKLRKELEAVGSKHNWQHITDQIGMFAYRSEALVHHSHAHTGTHSLSSLTESLRRAVLMLSVDCRPSRWTG